MRAEHVRGVEASAEPGLDDGDVDLARGELGEGRGAERLKLRRLLRLRLRPDPLDRRLEVGLLTVDCDPLRPRADVRRDRRPDGQAFGEQQRLDRPRRRRLPVRADDVDRRTGGLRVAERGEQRPHPSEPEFLRPRAEGCEPGGAQPERASSSRRYRSRLALGLDHLGLRVRDELLVREHPLAALDLAAEALDLGGGVSVHLARSGRTTASKSRFSSPASSTTTPLRRNIAAASWTGRSASLSAA